MRIDLSSTFRYINLISHWWIGSRAWVEEARRISGVYPREFDASEGKVTLICYKIKCVAKVLTFFWCIIFVVFVCVLGNFGQGSRAEEPEWINKFQSGVV